MKLYYLFLISLFLLNCEGFKKAPDAQSGTDQPSTIDPTNPQGPSFPPEQTAKWGQPHKMLCHESQMEQFNTELKKFLSTTKAPNEIPPVNCSDKTDLTGGLFFGGKAVFENGALFDLQSTSQQLDVSDNSYLEIQITGTDHKKFVKFTMQAVPYAGGVSGNIVTLAFADNKGKVLLNGAVENGQFLGIFEYENFTTWQGEISGYSGQLGRFSLPACDLLKCSAQPLQRTIYNRLTFYPIIFLDCFTSFLS